MALRLHQRGSTWHAAGTVAGRRIRQSLGTGDRKTAEIAAAELERRIQLESIYGPGTQVSFEEAALAYMQAGGESRFLAPLLIHFRGVRLDSIKPGHVLDAAAKLYPKAKPATRKRQAICPAVAVINFGHQRGWCAPIRVKARSGPAPVRQAVDHDYIRAVRQAALESWRPMPHLATAVLFLHLTGCRVSEAIALKPGDVDLAAGRAQLHMTKNGEPRSIALPAPVAAEMAELPPRAGRALGYETAEGLRRSLKKCCARAGLPYLGTHQIGRHSFATHLGEMGWTAEAIADAGGWKSPGLVAKTYVHPERAAERAAAQLGDTWLTQRPGARRTSD